MQDVCGEKIHPKLGTYGVAFNKSQHGNEILEKILRITEITEPEKTTGAAMFTSTQSR